MILCPLLSEIDIFNMYLSWCPLTAANAFDTVSDEPELVTKNGFSSPVSSTKKNNYVPEHNRRTATISYEFNDNSGINAVPKISCGTQIKKTTIVAAFSSSFAPAASHRE